MRKGERVFRILLLAYPADFRRGFGEEMRVLFNDTRREGGSRLRFWRDFVSDVARSALRLHAEALREAWNHDTHTRRGRMRPMAILALLFGVLEAINAGAEGVAGIRGGDDASLLAGALGILAGGALAAAGVAILRKRGTGWVRGAALGCLLAFMAVAFVKRLSILALAIGIAIPIALLLVIRASRRGDPPMVA